MRMGEKLLSMKNNNSRPLLLGSEWCMCAWCMCVVQSGACVEHVPHIEIAAHIPKTRRGYVSIKYVYSSECTCTHTCRHIVHWTHACTHTLTNTCAHAHTRVHAHSLDLRMSKRPSMGSPTALSGPWCCSMYCSTFVSVEVRMIVNV